MYLDSVPKDTKRIQVKAYCVKDSVSRYLLCTMLNNRGWPLEVKQGTNSISYENVFVSEMGVILGLSKCDHVFFQPIKVPQQEVDDEVKKRKWPEFESGDTCNNN